MTPVTTKLGEVVDLVMGQAPPSADTNFDGRGIPFVKVGEFGALRPVIREWTTKPLRMARRSDVLLCVVGATCGKINLGEDCAIGRSVAAIRPHPSSIDQFYLYYFMMTLVEQLRNGSIGAAQTVISKDMVESVQIPLPPLSEQKAIVANLDEAFASLATATANAEKNLQNARAIFESHLQSVFTQIGDGWEETTLERVLSVQPQNGWSPPAANHANAGTPVLTLSAVTGFRFRPDKFKFTSAPVDFRRNYWVENGDLLITRSNTPELVGHVAIAEKISEPTIYPDLIMRMRPMPGRALTEFLYYQMRAPALRKAITGRAQGANPTMKKISNGAVRTLPIVVPPLVVQKEIVETLNTLASETQRLTSIYQRKIRALGDLKRSILHGAFSGNLQPL